jgi:hypothetical protein
MSCARVRPLLTDLALGTPGTPEVLSHLAACAACRQALAEERRVADRLVRKLEASLASGGDAGLAAQVRGLRAEPPSHGRRALPWLVAVAAGMGLALGLLRTAQPPGEPGRVRPSAPQATPSPRPAAPRASVAPPPARRTPRARRAAPTALPPAAPAGEPQVLVPAHERTAFERLLSGRRRWQWDAAPRLGEGLAPLELEQLTITPLDLEPIDANDRTRRMP